MANPIIIIDSATGSDTAASGAGPGDGTTSGSAHTNSTGRTRNAASQSRFGLFGYTNSISDVLTDGTHVIYMNISTAGARNFSSISAKKDTREVVTGAITSGTAILSLSSSTGMTAGDVIKVSGAGSAGADLFSTILTVDSSVQVTLNDNASTTVGPSANVECPRQVTLTSGQGVNTGTTDTTWAIGGKRAAILSSSSSKLIENNSGNGDAMPGWIMRMLSGHGAGNTDTRSSTLKPRRIGTSSGGPIILEGVDGAATLPLLSFSNNGECFGSSGGAEYGYWRFRNFRMENTAASKTASVAFSVLTNNTVIFENIKINSIANKFWKGFVLIGSLSITLRDCIIMNCANVGIDFTNSFNNIGFRLYGSEIRNCGSHGIRFSPSTNSNFSAIIMFSQIVNNSGRGIYCDDTSGTANAIILIGSVIHGNSSHGLDYCGTQTSLTHTAQLYNNNITGNAGYGLLTKVPIIMQSGLWHGGFNNFGSGSGNSNGSGANSGIAAFLTINDKYINPNYVDTSTGVSGANFRNTNSGIFGIGYPTGVGNTVPKFDIGFQHLDSGVAGGGGILGQATWDGGLM